MSKIQRIDNRVLDYLLVRMKGPRMDRFMPVITRLGNGGLIWICISLVLLLNTKHKYTGERVLASLIVGSIIANFIIKPIVGRKRPCQVMPMQTIIKRPRDYSFPSGHSLSSFSAATILFYVNPYIGMGSLVLASLIALSRVYLGVHYPSDIAAGMLLGVFISLIVIRY